MAEITQVFSRPRRTFGRHCEFSDVDARLLAVVPSRDKAAPQYIDGFCDESNDFRGDVRWTHPKQKPLDDLWVYQRRTTSEFDTCPSMSVTEYNGVSGVNTDRADWCRHSDSLPYRGSRPE